MNAYDNLQYFENCYDSFCSDFVIPRAHTSQSSHDRPSSANHADPYNKPKDDIFSNHFYYFDRFSDAFPSKCNTPEQMFQQESQGFVKEIGEDFITGNNVNEVNCSTQNNIMHLSASSATLQQLQPYNNPFFKKKGPTPPPKPKLIRQCMTESTSELLPPNLADTDTPHFISNVKMEDTSYSYQQQHPPNQQRHFHQSFESVASCPIPPPPKYVQAPSNNDNYCPMSHEMLSTYPSPEVDDLQIMHSPQNYRKLSEPPHKPSRSSILGTSPSHRRKEPIFLSEFLRLSSNNVFKKPPFFGKNKHGSSPLLCGHFPPSNEGNSSTSPTPSATSSSAEAGGGIAGENPSRPSVVLSFRKKCGVTKRRKKIDESLFTPQTTSSSSCEVLNTTKACNTSKKSSQKNEPFPLKSVRNTTGPLLADSAKYSITNFAENSGKSSEPEGDHHPHHSSRRHNDGVSNVVDDGISFMAETNHDAEFDLDPLPEKDSDDVLDFSWALPISQVPASISVSSFNKKGNFTAAQHQYQPPPPPLPLSLPSVDGIRRKQSDMKLQPDRGKKGNCSGGNGRPSSRCSLIINSLMGHISGRNKSGSHHHSHQTNSSRIPDHLRDDLDEHHHPTSIPPFTEGKLKKKSLQSKLRKSSNKNNLINDANANSCHYHRMESPRPPSEIDSLSGQQQSNSQADSTDGHNQILRGGRQQQSFSSEMLTKHHTAASLFPSSESTTGLTGPPSHSNNNGNERSRGAVAGLTASYWGRPRSIAAFNLDIDTMDDGDNNMLTNSAFHSSFRSGSRSLGNINAGHCHNNDEGGYYGSFPSLANVIGCIPRVSLSNANKIKAGRSSTFHDESEIFQQHQHSHQIKPIFAFRREKGQTCNSTSYNNDDKQKRFQESNSNVVMTVAAYQHQQKQQTCCGGGSSSSFGGLFGGDPTKFDKYYGQYSLTGLNLPMINSDGATTANGYANSLDIGKSEEEIVLDRYYAHCNKVVRNKPMEQKKKKKMTSDGKRGNSISEKIWRNVSLPIINSNFTNNKRNQYKQENGTHLCGHRRAKQIEECFYCLNEEVQEEKSSSYHSNNHQSPPNHWKQDVKDNCRKKKAKSQSMDQLSLLHPGQRRKGKGEERDLEQKSGQHDHRHQRGLIKLKRFPSSNSISSSGCSSSEAPCSPNLYSLNPSFGQQKQGGNVNKLYQPRKQLKRQQAQNAEDEDDDPSAVFSYSLHNTSSSNNKVKSRNCSNESKANAPLPPITKFKETGPTVNLPGHSSSSLTIDSTSDDHDEDGGAVNGTEFDERVVGVPRFIKSKGQGNVTNNQYHFVQGKGESVLRRSSSNNNRQGASAEEYGYDNDDNEMKEKKTDKKYKKEGEGHARKLKMSGGGKEINGISSRQRNTTTTTTSSSQDEEDDGIMEDSSGSSEISSLPTCSSSHHRDHDDDDGDRRNDDEKLPNASKDNKKNRVKWTFLTSGLAKATRKLSSGSSRSSLGSFATCSDSSSSKKEEDQSSSSRAAEVSSSGSSIIDIVGGIGRKKNEKEIKSSKPSKRMTMKPVLFMTRGSREVGGDDKIVKRKEVKSFATTNQNESSLHRRSTENYNQTVIIADGTSIKRRNTAEVFMKNNRHAGVFYPVGKTGSLRRKPSTATGKRKQKSHTVEVMMPSSSMGNETQQLQSGVLLRKKVLRPFPPPPLPPTGGRALNALSNRSSGVAMRGVMKGIIASGGQSASIINPNTSRVFSAFSNSSCNSSASDSNRSSSSGYTSNVSRRTSAFLKSFRKRWAKKNNKVADGDEEDAYRSHHDNDDDSEEEDVDGDINDNDVADKSNNNACVRSSTIRKINGDKRDNNNSCSQEENAFGAINRLNTIRRKSRRTSSRAARHAIFSTFYIGPVIKDPMEEEKIYVTKDFDDVTLDLQSGEVKKTSDGTLLFTADPFCFASRRKLQKKREKLLKLNKKMKEKQTKESSRKGREDRDKRSDKTKHVSSSTNIFAANVVAAAGVSGKTNNTVISQAHNHEQDKAHNQRENEIEKVELRVKNSCANSSRSGCVGGGDSTCIGKPCEVISDGDDGGKWDNCNNVVISGDASAKKRKSFRNNNNGSAHTSYYTKLKGKRKGKNGETTCAAVGKRSGGEVNGRSIISPRLIKSYLGISKDLLVGANGKNQSADDLSGGNGVEEPDTPTRSGGLLGRLRDSSRSGFGFSSNSGASSRGSSKKRSSSSKQHENGFQMSQTDSPISHPTKSHNSLSDSRGCADDGNEEEGASGKLSSGHQPSCSSEEELTSINSCENQLSSLTLGKSGGVGDEEGEYNGPFQGQAVALTDCSPSLYDRHALRYKKGDIIDIISKKPTGLWVGKVNGQIGTFKFINVELLHNPFASACLGGGGDNGREKDEEEEDIIDDGDEDDSAGDYADTSNYNECAIHFVDGSIRGTVASVGGEECSCSASSRRVNDHRRAHRQNNKGGEYQGDSKRLAGAFNPWEVEQRQSVENAMNGYGAGSKRSMEKGKYGDPLGIMSGGDDEEHGEGDDDDVEGDDDQGNSQTEDEDEENDDEVIENELLDGETLNQNQIMTTDAGGKRQVMERKSNKKKDGKELVSSRKKGKKQSLLVRKGRPTCVGDLLQRINLEQYTKELEEHGFESLDILKELEEEDLDKIGIIDASDRTKILTAVERLRGWDDEADHIPGQTLYQFKYYQATMQKSSKRGGGGVNTHAGVGSNNNGGSISQLTHGINVANNMSRLMGKGSPVTLQQSGTTTLSSPHFYRLHHPRDSGIFVGKGDGEEDGDEPISGADMSCAESHPDVETEEIILSPINLQKSSSSSVTTGKGSGGGSVAGNPNAAWHQHHHQKNNNKQGSHHHINRFISKGGAAPPGAILSGSGNNSGGIASSGTVVVQTAQQPTSSASSSGSSSSSSGIATAGDSFWNSCSNTNSNGSSSSGTSGGGPQTSSVVVEQNHSQWSKQGKARDHHRRDPSPAYNTDSVRNRFLQAKSLFETSNPTITSGNAANPTGGKTRVPAHVYENGGLDDSVMETQSHHLHLQRVGSQGKPSQNQQQQQNRFLYCEKSSDSGISVCTNSPPPLRNEYRN